MRDKSFRFSIRPTPSNHLGEQAIYLSLRVGYYPCLKAPFIQVCLFFWRIDFWYGLPTHKRL